MEPDGCDPHHSSRTEDDRACFNCDNEAYLSFFRSLFHFPAALYLISLSLSIRAAAHTAPQSLRSCPSGPSSMDPLYSLSPSLSPLPSHPL